MALSLETAPSLRVLHLKRNKLGGVKAMEALGKMLGSQHGLRELVLSENLIGTSLGYLAVPCSLCYTQPQSQSQSHTEGLYALPSVVCLALFLLFLCLHPSRMQSQFESAVDPVA